MWQAAYRMSMQQGADVGDITSPSPAAKRRAAAATSVSSTAATATGAAPRASRARSQLAASSASRSAADSTASASAAEDPNTSLASPPASATRKRRRSAAAGEAAATASEPAQTAPGPGPAVANDYDLLEYTPAEARKLCLIDYQVSMINLYSLCCSVCVFAVTCRKPAPLHGARQRAVCVAESLPAGRPFFIHSSQGAGPSRGTGAHHPPLVADGCMDGART